MLEPSDAVLLKSNHCKHCNEKYSTENLNDHEQTCEKLSNFILNKGDECFQCQLCSMTFPTKGTACEHINSSEDHMEKISEMEEDEEGNKEDIDQSQMPIGKFEATKIH